LITARGLRFSYSGLKTMLKRGRLFVLAFIAVGVLAAVAWSQTTAPAGEPLVVSGLAGSDKITLDIKGMDLVDVLKMLAARSGTNIVVGKNVTGKVTLFLKDVDIWNAFEIILAANDLAYEKKNSIIYVMTQRDYESLYGERYQDKKKVEIVKLEYAKAIDIARTLNQMKSSIGKVVVDENSNTLVLMDAAEQIKEMTDFIEHADIPIQTRVFNLNYAQAEKLSAKIQETVTKGVGNIKIDERTNKIAVTDYPDKLNEIERILRAFDEKTQQVLIDAQIIEVSPSDKFEMGVDWDFWIRKNFKISGSLPISHTGRLLLGTADVLPKGKGEYKAILDLLRTIGETKILSSPRIMTLNNQEAKILVGSKEAYITSTTSQSGSGTTVISQNVNFVDVGIKLYVTPAINTDGFITMKIRPEISTSKLTDITSVGQITQVPIVSTSETETTVMVKDGITIIIGGLRKDEKTKTVTKIPLLGDIPFLGTLFRKTSDEVKRTELVILLTPHIMSGENAFTEFSDIRPVDGAITRMQDGNLTTERITPSSSAVGRLQTEEEYRKLVWSQINTIAADYIRRGNVQGRAEVVFTVLSNGSLKDEPRVVSSDSYPLYTIAIRSIKAAAPFPAFPIGVRKPEIVFRTTFYAE